MSLEKTYVVVADKTVQHQVPGDGGEEDGFAYLSRMVMVTDDGCSG